MIIKLSEDYEKEVFDFGIPDSDFACLERLLENMRDKKLFLLASTSFYKYLIDNYFEMFSQSVKGLIKDVYNRSTTLLSDAQKRRPLILITTKYTATLHESGTACVSLQQIPNELSPYICCENVDDATYYMTLYRKLGRSPTNLYILKDGFGGSCQSSIENWFFQNRIFFSIVDSDKRFFGDDQGNTASVLQGLYDEKNPVFSAIYVLSVHEKENLIPMELLHVSTKAAEAIKNFVIKKSGPLSDEYRDYFDIKDGIKIQEADNISAMPPGWQRLYGPIINLIRSNGLEHSKMQSNTKKLFAGIGSAGIDKTVEKGIDYSRFLVLLTSNQKADLFSIFESISQFGYVYSSTTN